MILMDANVNEFTIFAKYALFLTVYVKITQCGFGACLILFDVEIAFECMIVHIIIVVVAVVVVVGSSIVVVPSFYFGCPTHCFKLIVKTSQAQSMSSLAPESSSSQSPSSSQPPSSQSQTVSPTPTPNNVILLRDACLGTAIAYCNCEPCKKAQTYYMLGILDKIFESIKNNTAKDFCPICIDKRITFAPPSVLCEHNEYYEQIRSWMIRHGHIKIRQWVCGGWKIIVFMVFVWLLIQHTIAVIK